MVSGCKKTATLYDLWTLEAEGGFLQRDSDSEQVVMFGLRLKKKSRVQLENNNNIFLYMHVCSVEFQQQVILQIFVIQKCLLSAQHLSSNERDGVSSSSATCSIFRSFTNPTTRQDAHQLSCKSEHYLRARQKEREKQPLDVESLQQQIELFLICIWSECQIFFFSIHT